MLQIGQLVPFPRTSVAFYGTDDDQEFRLMLSVMRITDDIFEAKLPGHAPMRVISCRSIRTLLNKPRRVYEKILAFVFRGHVDLVHVVLGKPSLDAQFTNKLHNSCILAENNDFDSEEESLAAIAIYAWNILN